MGQPRGHGLTEPPGPGPCPLDGHPLQNVSTEHGIAGVCPDCRGIWLPPPAMRSLRRETSSRGWLCYVEFPRSTLPGGKCPSDRSAMPLFDAGYGFAVQCCDECGGLWLPGAALRDLNDRARRRAGGDEPFPITDTSGLAIGPASSMVGFDPRVVHELLFESASVWLPWRRPDEPHRPHPTG